MMLVAQIGEAYAAPLNSCTDHNGMVMSATMMSNGDTMDHSQHDMSKMEKLVAVDENSDCCQQDCCCPMVMLASVALVNTLITSSLNIIGMQPVDINTSVTGVFIALPQRPPKTFHSLTA